MHPSCPVGPGRNCRLLSFKDLARGYDLWTRGGLPGVERETSLTSLSFFFSGEGVCDFLMVSYPTRR